MAVGLRVRSNAWVVGSQEFLFAFFGTVAHRLEPEGWGTRFPTVQGELYRGKVSPDGVPALQAELAAIHEELKRFPPSDVVWDIEELSARPPWGDDISPDITDLSNYFVTSDGRDLFEVFREAVSYAERAEVEVSIEPGL